MKVWETVTAKNLVYQYRYIDYDKPTTQSKVLMVEKTEYQAYGNSVLYSQFSWNSKIILK